MIVKTERKKERTTSQPTILNSMFLLLLLFTHLINGSDGRYYKVDGHTWTHRLINHFGNQADGPFDKSNAAKYWQAQSYSIAADNSKARERLNVLSNVYIKDGFLNLRTQKYNGSGPVLVAEIDSIENRILFGSFRGHYRVQPYPGCVAGFFIYRNETQEIDIEILTHEKAPHIHAHCTNQPSYNATCDCDEPGTTFTETLTRPWTELQEYRFDWLPTVTKFYRAGNHFTGQLFKHVPVTPASFIINMWSNGDPTFSQGPPTRDVVLQVRKLKFYYNITSG